MIHFWLHSEELPGFVFLFNLYLARKPTAVYALLFGVGRNFRFPGFENCFDCV